MFSRAHCIEVNEDRPIISGKKIALLLQILAMYRLCTICRVSDSWPRFQGHSIQCQISGNSYKIELYSQWQTDRKSHDLSSGAIFNYLE